jgi:GNAT superfamily N-acetyltransferase
MPEVRDIAVSFAEPTDIAAIKSMADLHRRELGFVLRPALADAIDRQWVLLARIRNSAEPAGFVHFRHRRDLYTKIYQICVMPLYRKQGVGAELLAVLKSSAHKAGQVLLTLQCPEDLSANSFYRAMGFIDETVINGRRRRLIIWSLPLCNLTQFMPEAHNADGR